MYDVVLSGYYGFKNSGDEALLKSIIADLKIVKPDIRIAVLSNDPEFTKNTCGVDSVYRMDFSAVLKILKNTRLLISGGGSLIQDATSTKSLLYYLGIIKLAKICGAKVMVYANGIGPVTGRVNRCLTRLVLNTVNCITLREEDSLSELENIGVTKPPMTVTADPALRLCASDNAAILKRNLFGEKPLVAVSVRSWKGFDEKIILEVSAVLNRLRDEGFEAFLLPMQYSKDFDICNQISQKSGCSVLSDGYSVEEITGLLSCCEAVVGMRLHAIVYAASSGTSPVGIVYDPKVCGFMKYIGLDSFIDIENLTADSLYKQIKDAVECKSKPDMTRFKELAFKNAEIAAELLKQ